MSLWYLRGRSDGGICAGVLFYVLFFLLTLLAGCDQQGATASILPEEGPEVVLKRFYGYITEAKQKGGGSPARAAFKMISAERSHLIEDQFLEVIRKYPPGFMVTVGKAEIKGTQAIVDISYKMPSIFNDGYTINEKIPLTIDTASNTWKVDFTGETYGMDMAEAKKIEAAELRSMK